MKEEMKEAVKKDIGMDACEKTPEDKVYRYEFRNLENQVKELQKTVRILTVLCDHYTKMSGIKVERFMDGIVIISQI